MKKRVDKRGKKIYNIEAVPRGRPKTGRSQRVLKKTSEKGLTKGTGCDMIDRLSRKGTGLGKISNGLGLERASKKVQKTLKKST